MFDFLNIPWNWDKQDWGSELEIICHWVSCDAITISLSDNKGLALAEKLSSFSKTLSHPLVEWSRMTGWANWGLNCFPLGRWALQSSWDKIAGKTLRNSMVPSNSHTRLDLEWLSKALLSWNGRQLLKTYFWRINEADLVFFCNACPSGLGLWIPKSRESFHLSLPTPLRDIYWAELTAAICCMAVGRERSAKRIVIFTDSENVVNLFSSHRAVPIVREMFSSAVEMMINNDLDFKVKHVPGEENVVADCLSRNNLAMARALIKDLSINPLTSSPPHMGGGIRRARLH